MRRREFITLIGGAAATLPLAARGQPTKLQRIGVLSPGHSEGADASRATLNGLLEGLRDLGYTEGQNITIEREYGEADVERLRELAAELVRRQVDVIVALSTTAARPAKQATNIIPIIAIAMADPVEDGLVASLARPGGKEAERAANTLGMQLQFVAAGNPAEIVGAFSTIAKERADALCIFPSAMLFAEYGAIANMAAERRAAGDICSEGKESSSAVLSRMAPTFPIYPDRLPFTWIKFLRASSRPNCLSSNRRSLNWSSI